MSLEKMNRLLLLPAALVTAAVVAMVAYFFRGDPEYPSSFVDEMVNRNGKEFPLTKMTVIVTGSTNGLGKMIASQLYFMGVTVIIAGRSASKCERTILEIKSKYPKSTGKLEFGIIDTSDLVSVASFAQSFLEGHKELHALINNAGIHYVSTQGDPLHNLNLPMKSAQGYDLAFATNYLGHFLLTELLVPVISKTSSFGSVINIASSYHFLGSGDMLLPKSNGSHDRLMPTAARSDINSAIHRELAYGNNKLAQVLHAKELHKRFTAMKVNVRTASICPGWVNTGILPDNIGGRIVGKLAFRVEEGILSTICALFDSSLKGGEFLGNSENFWARQQYLMTLSDQLGLKGPVCSALAMWLLLFQKMSFGKIHVEPSSPDSVNSDLAEKLYDWSKSEVSSYLPVTQK